MNLLATSGLFGCTCFVRGTQVATPSGSRPIERLEVGEVVDARLHGVMRRRRIRAVHTGMADRLLDLRTTSTVVRGVTPGHQLAVPGPDRWRASGELVCGDFVCLRDAPERLIERVERVLASPVPVYNLVLDGDGAFLASGFVAAQWRAPARRAAPRVSALVAAASLVLASCGGEHPRPEGRAFAGARSADTDTDTAGSDDTGWERSRAC